MARTKSGKVTTGNVPAGDWLKKVSRSIGSLSSNMIANMMPATFDTVSNASSDIQEMKQFAREYRANQRSMLAEIKEATGFDEVEKGLNNLREDLRSGNFNNMSRDGFNFDFEDDFDLDMDMDDESIGNDLKAGVMTTKATIETSKATLEAMERQTAKISNAVLTGSKATYNINAATLKTVNTAASQVTAGLTAINENLGMIVRFNSENMTNFVNASLQYYNDSIGILNKILDSQVSMQNRQQAPPNQKSEIQQLREDLLNGPFSMKNYAKMIKKNMSESFGGSSIGLMASMFDKSTMKDIAANPLGFMLPIMMQAMVPKNISKSLKNFDSVVKNFFPGMMMKANGLKNSENPLLQMLGNLLGVNVNRKTSADLSKFGNGAMAFDGDTKKAILEQSVYLRKICAAVTGEDEFMIDRTTNKLRSMKDIRRDFDTRKRNAQTFAFSDIMSDIRDTMQDIKFSTWKEQENFMKQVENFFMEASKKDGILQRRNKNDDFGIDTIDDVLDQSGMDYDSKRLFKAIWRKIPKGKKANALVNDVTESRMGLTKFYEELENNNIFTAINMDSNLKSKKKAGATFGGFNPTDKFGRGTLDYLHDIQTLLIKGIKVFPGTSGGEEPRHLKAMLDKITTTKEVTSSPSFYSGAISTQYTEAELASMKRKGQIGINTISDLYDVSDEELANAVRYNPYGSTKNKRSMLSKILPESVYGKLNKGSNKIAAGVDKITDGMYKLLFGREMDQETSVLGSFDKRLKSFFSGTSKWMTDNILTPMHNVLFGDKGLFTQIKQSQLYGAAKSKAKAGINYVLGEKDTDGNRKNGLISGVYGELTDTFRSIKSFFTGKDYVNSKGKTIKFEGQSVTGEIKNVFAAVGSSIKEKYMGTKDKGKGLITGALDSLYEGILNFKEAFTGKKFDMAKAKEQIAQDGKTIKEMLPKSLAWGTIGATAGLFGGSAGLLGTLGGFFLPGGPIGGALIGSGLGMISQSERMKTFIFGPKDEKGDRLGGLVSKDFSTFFKKHKSYLMAGAGVGALKGLILGNGVIPSFFLGGGPIGGALMGLGTSMVYKSKLVQDFLFGKMGENGERDKTGFINKISDKFKAGINKVKGKNNNDIHWGTVGAGAIGGAALSSIVGQFGLLGGMMTLGGSPLLGSLLGAAAGISLSSEKWKKAIFGEDVEGTKKGGKLTKFANMFKVEVAGALRDKIDHYKFKFDEWFIKGISIPMHKMLDPFTTEIKYIGGKMKDKGKSMARFVTGMFKETIGDPVVNLFKSFVVKPLGKMMNILVGGTAKMAGALVSAPFKLGGWIADGLSEKQERRGLKHYKKDINRKMMRGEMGLFEGLKAKYFDFDAREEAKIGEFGASYKTMSAARARKEGRPGSSAQEYEQAALTRLAQLKEEREKRAEQQRLRKEYAKSLGYDNFRGDKNESWIYGNDVNFSRDENGKVIATKLGPVTKTDMNVDDIKDTNQIIADRVSEIAKTIKSGGNTTSDMVIPTPGSGKSSKKNDPRAGIITGGALGLASIIDKEQEEKAQEDKTKFVSRKNVSYLNEQSAEKAKADEEKSFKEKLLSGVTGIKDSVKEHSSNWGSMFGKKGVITIAILGGMALLGKIPGILNKLGLIGDKEEDHLENETTKAQLHMGKNFVTKTKVGKAAARALDKKIVKKFAGEGAEAGAKKVAKEVTEETAESVMREAVEGGAEAGAKAGVSSAVKEGQQGIVKTFLRVFNDRLTQVLEKPAIKKITEKLSKSIIGKVAKEVTEKISQACAKGLSSVLVKKLTSGMAKAGVKAVATIGTAGIIDAGFAIYDSVSGWLNVGNLFGVHDDDADATMKVVSSIMNAVLGFSFIGPLIDVATEIVSAVMGLNIKRFMAETIYKFLATQEEADELDANQKKIDDEYDRAVSEGFDGSKDDFIREQNKGWIGRTVDKAKDFGGKVWDGIKNTGSAIWEGAKSFGNSVKNFFTGEDDPKPSTNNTSAPSNSSPNVANNKSGGTYSGTTTTASSGAPTSAMRGYGFGPSTTSTVTMGNSITDLLGTLNISGDKFRVMKDQMTNVQKAMIKLPEMMDYSLGRMFNIMDENGKPMKITDATTTAFQKTNQNLATIVTKSHDFFSKAKTKITSVLSRQQSNLSNYEPALNNMMSNITGLTAGNAMATSAGLTDSSASSSSSSSSSSGGFFGTVKSVASSAWNGVKSIGSSIWNGAKNLFGFGYGPDDNNNFTYYSQNDPRWGGSYYGSINGKDTNRQDLATRGCAPTSMAMVASELTGQTITPDQMAAYSYSRGYSVKGGTDYNMIPDAANSLGLSARDLTQENSLKSALNSNTPVIATGMSPVNSPATPYTTGGHYVVMTGMKNGMVNVKDPLSPSRNGYYDLKTIASQTNKAFAIGNSGDVGAGFGKGSGFGRKFFGFGPSNVTGMDLVNSAKKLLGKPYTWGGNYKPLGSSPGTDCSGLSQ